jgi:Xaa-Pro aminopeptidase
MTVRIYSNRLRALRSALKQKKVDAFVLFTHENDNKNVLYLSGFSGTSAILIVTSKEAHIGVDSRYTERARIEAPHFTLIDIKSKQSFSDVIEEALERSSDKSIQKIGYEGFRVPVLTAKAWDKKISQKLIPLEDIVGRLRQYKNKDEIQVILIACRRTDRAFEEVARRIRAGMREIEVAHDIDATLRRHGAIENSFSTIVASGPNAAIPHHNTGDRKLRAGEPVVVDFGGRFKDGFCSDLTRTVFVPGKKPDPEMKHIYEIALGANRAAFRALRPGITWKAYDGIARSYIEGHGYAEFFAHGLGHSLGLEAHDPYDYRNDSIRAGTVFTNEPGIYLPGRGGVRIEDDIVMTPKGPERLTRSPYLT